MEDNNTILNDRNGEQDTVQQDFYWDAQKAIEKADEPMNFEVHMQVVSFLIGAEEYAIDILYIHEINNIVKITRVPNTPDFIKGVINLRGNIVPVVDLRKKFGLPSKKIDEESKLIVIEMEQKLVAIIVDAVLQTLRIQKNDIELATDMILGISRNYIQGVAKYQGRLVILLKLSQALLDEEEDGEEDREKEEELIK